MRRHLSLYFALYACVMRHCRLSNSFIIIFLCSTHQAASVTHFDPRRSRARSRTSYVIIWPPSVPENSGPERILKRATDDDDDDETCKKVTLRQKVTSSIIPSRYRYWYQVPVASRLSSKRFVQHDMGVSYFH